MNDDSVDQRWGNEFPWFLRYPLAPTHGDWNAYFRHVQSRLAQLMDFNETGVVNPEYFAARLETASLRRFRHILGTPPGKELKAYFDPGVIHKEARRLCHADVEEQLVDTLRAQQSAKASFSSSMSHSSAELEHAEQAADRSRPMRIARYKSKLTAERIHVLETCLRMVYVQSPGILADFVRDLNRAAADTRVAIRIDGEPPRIIPMEERLLQQEVIDSLLGRLQALWPERARELVDAYHDLLAEQPFDEVFSKAYKTLEAIGRAISGDDQFDFNPDDLKRYFPQLHPTIHKTFQLVRAHRGDAAAHGRKSPSASEMRYLLFQVCNMALLLLDEASPISD